MRVEFQNTRSVRRRASLAPMIDVVFLLLIFFMLAAQLGRDAIVPLRANNPDGSGRNIYEGPPRLVTFSQDVLALNGREMSLAALIPALRALMPDPLGEDGPQNKIILQPKDGATVEHMLELMAVLRSAGLNNLAVIE